MSTLDELKRKYSGGTVPDWELEKAGLKPSTGKAEEPPPPRRKIKLPKVEESEEGDGDGN